MLGKELNKVFIKQKGICFFGILLLLKMTFVIFGGYDSHYLIDQNEQYDTDYMNRFQGEITEEKQEEMESEYDKVYHGKDGSLDSSQREKAFQVIYHQYIYEKEKGGGVLLDTRGWQSILEHDDLDFFMVIFVILISSMLFCAEYETEMDVLLLSSREGKFHTVKIKIALGLFCGAFFSFVFQMVNFIYLKFSVGFGYGNCLLKSLEMFEKTQYKISLRMAVVMLVAMKVLGGMLLAAVSMSVAILLKKKSLSLIVGFLLVLIPETVCSKGAIGYYLPLPLGLCRASGYLWSDIYESGIDEQGDFVRQCIFREIPITALWGLLFLFVVELVILCGFCFMKFSKTSLKFVMPIKRSAYIFTLAVPLFFLGGCGKYNGEQLSIELEDGQEVWQMEKGKVEIDPENNTVVYTDSSGRESVLTKDVFPLELTIHSIFVHGKECYYLMENDTDTGICVRKVNLEDYSDVLVYVSVEENIEDFYGLKTESQNEGFDNSEDTRWFFVSNRYIYLKKKNYIMQINKKSRRQKIVADQVEDGKVTYDKGKLSYMNANKEWVVYEEE